MRYQGKVVVITGASSGIGRALAVWYAREGAAVGVLARREDRLRELCEEIRSSGGRAAYRVADATNRTETLDAIRQLQVDLGPCDILIANAGVGIGNTATNLEIPGAEQVIKTNLLGPMYAIEAVLPAMLERRTGQIVGISSVAAFKGLPGAAAYCASKSGLSGYLESLRISLRRQGIAVTTICPGFVQTAMTEKNDGMLWVMTPERAAVRIANAIRRRKKVYIFPKRMRLLIALTRWLPDWLMARAVPE
jgi:short-subunit dehydrogenase